MASAGTVTLNLDANSVKMIRELQKAQKQTKRSAGRMQRDMKKAFTAMAKSAAVFGVAMVAATKVSVDFANKIGKTADKIGVNVEALQELRFAAARAGVEQRTLDMALQRFTRRVGEAAIGTGEAKDALAQMGFQLRDGQGRIRSTEDLLRDVADAFSKVQDPAERLRLSFKLFDSEGAALVNMLSNGSEGLNKITQEARDLGVVMKESLVRDAERAADKMGDFQKVLQVRVAETVVENADAIITLTNALIGFVGIVGQAVQGWDSWLSAQGVGVNDLKDIHERGNKLLEERLDIEERLKGWLPNRHRIDLEARRNEIIKEQLELQTKAIELQRKQSPSGVDAPTVTPSLNPDQTQTDADKITGIINGLITDIEQFGLSGGDKALVNLIDMGATEEQIALFRQATNEMRLLVEQEEIANAVLEEIVVTAQKVPVSVQQSTDELTEFGVQAARNMQTAFADFLFDPFEDGVKGMAESFAKTIQRMAADAAAHAILNAIFGAMAGSSNSILAGIGAQWGGGKASGGPVSAGTSYLVGEKGPEILHMGASSGNIIPNDKLGGGIVNNISIDARETDDPARMLAMIPLIQSQVEQSISLKNRRGYL